tara:strand:+ start:2482 stop:3015 length:534 start_codon:yes stop_codon:yes gene_type:complete
MKYLVVFSGIVMLLLAGCSERSKFVDIDNELAEASLSQWVKIEPIPSFPAQRGYIYQSQAQRHPFQPFYSPIEVSSFAKSTVAKPDLMRVKEPLEFFALTSLEMVGSLGNTGQLWGLINDPTGTISRVTVGDRIGRNFGKIIKVSKSEIVLEEKISSEPGVWFGQSRSILISVSVEL